jgi:pimeloyl-ACP methyl ester carboxylesterase
MPRAGRLNTREGTLTGGLYYSAIGDGPPLVQFRTVLPSYKKPTGLAQWAERRSIQPLTQRFTVYSVSRRPGLEPGATMAEIAADYARALEDEFNGASVDLLGFSTGGSIALQFAADYPERVHRLALAATASRLGPFGRGAQRRYSDHLARSQYRQALSAAAPALTASRSGQWFLGTLLWLLAPLSRIEDASGMVAVLLAEDSFDLGDRLREITAPTLLISGEHDRVYPPDISQQTVERIPHAQFILYKGRSHRSTLTDQRLLPDIIAFLTQDHSF